MTIQSILAQAGFYKLAQVVCFLVSLSPDRENPFGGLSFNVVNLVNRVHVSVNSRSSSTFQ